MSSRKASDQARTKTAVRSDEFIRHFAWIDWVLKREQTTDAGLAKLAGLPANAIYRKRADQRPLAAIQIRAITDSTGLPGPETYLQPNAAGLAEEAARFDPADGVVDPVLAGLVEAALIGRHRASAWRLNTRALENSGYLVGDIVIVDEDVAPMAGDAVCARVYDMRTGIPETVFRIMEMPYLIAASSDPSLRKPMLVDDERVIVAGTVTESFRTRRR